MAHITLATAKSFKTYTIEEKNDIYAKALKDYKITLYKKTLKQLIYDLAFNYFDNELQVKDEQMTLAKFDDDFDNYFTKLNKNESASDLYMWYLGDKEKHGVDIELNYFADCLSDAISIKKHYAKITDASYTYEFTIGGHHVDQSRKAEFSMRELKRMIFQNTRCSKLLRPIFAHITNILFFGHYTNGFNYAGLLMVSRYGQVLFPLESSDEKTMRYDIIKRVNKLAYVKKYQECVKCETVVNPRDSLISRSFVCLECDLKQITEEVYAY